ncbi:hypothetical protein MPLA_2130135 [Mesorhizobium sp. ORS 3359]|nr:hypothetical protein MPLA_2130135 [Mesorhizobium sp. ORS 3359]
MAALNLPLVRFCQPREAGQDGYALSAAALYLITDLIAPVMSGGSIVYNTTLEGHPERPVK